MYRHSILCILLLCSGMSIAQEHKKDLLISAGGTFRYSRENSEADPGLVRAYESVRIGEKTVQWSAWLNPMYALTSRWLLGFEVSYSQQRSSQQYYVWYIEPVPDPAIPSGGDKRIDTYYNFRRDISTLRGGPSIAWTSYLSPRVVLLLRGSVYMLHSRTTYQYDHPFRKHRLNSPESGIGMSFRPHLLYFLTYRLAMELVPLQVTFEQPLDKSPERHFGLNALLSPISIGINYRL